MKRLVVLLAVAAALIGPAAASAHPLGNFTINRFSRVEVSGPRVYVRYVLDLAEIPTFQAGHIDRRAYATRIARNAKLDEIGAESIERIADETFAKHATQEILLVARSEHEGGRN